MGLKFKKSANLADFLACMYYFISFFIFIVFMKQRLARSRCYF